MLLSKGEGIEFSALQPHQRHAWYALLVQVAALALHASGKNKPWGNTSDWRDGLLLLTAEKAEPYSLVIDDLSKPAFLQPPVPEGSLKTWKHKPTPDLIDLLVTSKNHDVKQATIVTPSAEHWVYALASTQTMNGYSGAKNYGISRMNGGYGSRSYFGVTSKGVCYDGFTRDVTTWLARRNEIAKDLYKEVGGLGLTWLEPWDGESSLSINQLDPLYIETCRRIRLTSAHQIVSAWTDKSSCRRIDAEHLKGRTGDIWTPIRLKDNAAFKVSGNGFSYKVISEVIFGDQWHRPPSVEITDADGETPNLLVWGLARGQGITEGLHERTIPLESSIVREKLQTKEGKFELGRRAQAQLDTVQKFSLKILKPALLHLLQGGPAALKIDDNRARASLLAFDREVELVFFQMLFMGLQSPAEETAQSLWIECVRVRAEKIFEQAICSLPIPSLHRYRAIARASRTLYGAIKNQFPGHLCPNKNTQIEGLSDE